MQPEILVIYIISLLVGAYILKPAKKEKQVSKLPYKRMFDIIDISIARELGFKMNDYKLREIVVIPNFENEVKTITRDICKDFEESFLDEVSFYHPKSYIIRYVSRHVREQLIEYMRVHNPNIK